MSATKLALMQIAASLTESVMGNCPDTLPVAEDLSEDAKTANGMAAAVFTSFYDFVSRAYQDERVFLSPPEKPAGGAKPKAAASQA